MRREMPRVTVTEKKRDEAAGQSRDGGGNAPGLHVTHEAADD